MVSLGFAPRKVKLVPVRRLYRLSQSSNMPPMLVAFLVLNARMSRDSRLLHPWNMFAKFVQFSSVKGLEESLDQLALLLNASVVRLVQPMNISSTVVM